mmetsp:Transcript_13290/g.17407  ORF Transcript_13290/g.17407 Transcript_13290/m.17407 type:complete len:81 (+) Transcript_13290:1998-2240(+)
MMATHELVVPRSIPMTSPASAPVLRARATALLLLEIGRRVRWDAIMRDAVSVVLDSIVLVLLLRYFVLMIVCYCDEYRSI